VSVEPLRDPPGTMPVGFVSHGAPTLALDMDKGADLARWAADLPTPTAVLVVSAHWEATPIVVGAPQRTRIAHDFHGFPAALYRLDYPAPGAPELAARLARELDARIDPTRGWDHGVWVPLRHMYASAEIPVVQVSLPSQSTPARLFEIGRSIAGLRDEHVLILASGGMVHNLRALTAEDRHAPPSWAIEFESWVREVLLARDWDRLIGFRDGAPSLRQAHPTLEHFLPLLFAAGAAADGPRRIRFPIEGFEFGSLSRLTVQFD